MNNIVMTVYGAKPMSYKERLRYAGKAFTHNYTNEKNIGYLTKFNNALGFKKLEYDEEKHMRQERETFWEDGWAAGREEGIREGEERGREFGRKEGRQEGKLDLLKDLIQKKLSKGKSTGAIAEELEIEEALVLELVQGMEK